VAELQERIASLQQNQHVAEREVMTRSTSQRLLDHRVAILAADKEVGPGERGAGGAW
jgi:hypothetical protein